jgi:hypothetical protein
LPGSTTPSGAARRAVAVLLLSSLALASLAPSLEAAAADGSDRCCRRGVCCHHRKPSDAPCLRGLCPCGGHEEGTPVLPVQSDAILPDIKGPTASDGAGRCPQARLAVLQSLDLSPPHAPPRSSSWS